MGVVPYVKVCTTSCYTTSADGKQPSGVFKQAKHFFYPQIS